MLGTAIVATETGTRNPENEWVPLPENQGQAAWETLYAALCALLPVAEQHGTILAVEGYVNHVINSPERLAKLLEQFPTLHLQVVLDPFNYLAYSQLPQKEQVVGAFLQQFKDRFVVAHLKDVSQEGAESDTPAFGQGVFPQQLYLNFLRPDPYLAQTVQAVHSSALVASFSFFLILAHWLLSDLFHSISETVSVCMRKEYHLIKELDKSGSFGDWLVTGRH
jgi:sugar phosphate isomerase/epimerase